MRKYLIVILILLACAVTHAQKGITYWLDSSGAKPYEKITGKRVWTYSGSHSHGGKEIQDSAWYWEVEYDYGEPPPEHWELVRSYLNGKLVDTIRQWRVEMKLTFSASGDWAMGAYDVISDRLYKEPDFFKLRYENQLTVSHGGYMSIDIRPRGYVEPQGGISITGGVLIDSPYIQRLQESSFSDSDILDLPTSSISDWSYDTVPAFILCSEEGNYKKAFWINGFMVRTPEEPYEIFLNRRKKPLSKNLTVWYHKSP